MPHDSPETLVFRNRKYWQNSNGVTPNGGAKRRWGRLKKGAIAENWRLSTRSVVSVVRSQVYQTELPRYLLQHVRRDAARVTRVCQRQLILVYLRNQWR